MFRTGFLLQRAKPAIWALACGLFVISCGLRTETASEEENLIAPGGKEDNFFSTIAREYLITADVSLHLSDRYKNQDGNARMARARRLMEGKTKQIAWFLHVYLVDKSRSDDHGEYGGMRAMVLDGSFESQGLKADPDDPLAFSYSLTMQIGGTKKLISLIQKDQQLDANVEIFDLQMAKLNNARLASFSHSDFGAGNWAPDACDCDLETQKLKITPIEPSSDAYLDYTNMLADKKMDVSVHFGWDYHARYDIYHARNFYRWLVNDMGFTSPVDSFQDYNRLSGPLTRTMTVNGEQIEARIWVFHPDPCESWDEAGPRGDWDKKVEEDKEYKKRSCPDYAWADVKANANPTTAAGARNMVDDLKKAMRHNDAIIFSGHSGYTYAYAMASWYKTGAGELAPKQIAAMALPKDKSQLFVVSGCDTYHVGQAFKDNPNKAGLQNADVVTTTSFSNSADLDDVKDIVRALVGDNKGTLEAQSFGRLLSKLNPSSWLPSSKFSLFTMYGVHGIDDNPFANPLGDASKSCEPCQQDRDCGASGNVCVRLNDDEKVCAVQCVADAGCGQDQVCRKFGSSWSYDLKGSACVPKSLSCRSEPIDIETKVFKAEGNVTHREELHYEIQVGPTAKNITVSMTGDGDADLYTNELEKPERFNHTCRPYRSNSKETCTFKSVRGETLYVMVRGFALESNFTLDVTWQ
jgi:hypothetical protein